MNHTLTPSEEQLMLLIWEKDFYYMREIMEDLPEPKPHQNTVSTFLKILVEKGFVQTEKEGRIAKYSPAISKENYRKFLLKRFIENYFDNSGKELYQILKLEKLISEEEQIAPKNHVADYILELTEEKKSKKKKKKDGKKKK